LFVNTPFKQPSRSQLNRIQKALTETPHTLLAYTDGIDDLLRLMQRISLQSGLAIYSWSSGRGLVSLKSRDVPVPGTRGLSDALRYADRSSHYGVYLFSAHSRDELVEMQAVLPKHRSWEALHDKKKLMFVLPAGQKVPALESSEYVKLINLDSPRAARVGLRDGQWVSLDG